MSGPHRHDGQLGVFVDGYCAWLLERGYSPVTVTKSLIALGHLGRWMEHEGIDVDRLDDAAVRAFVATQVRVRGRLPLASVRPLLDYLRDARIVPPEPAGPVTEIDELVDEYRDWLLVERRLAPSTVRSSERLARRFLAERISAHDATGPVEITGADVTGFLMRESGRVSPRLAGCIVCQVRSLLRYLAARGLADPGLVDAVPRIALWRDSAIPRFPAPAAVDALLASCDRSSLVGARDYAALMLLARLGLRAIEVSRLQLSDLDWRAGEIELDGKAHQRGRLPLPADVGEALVAYLRVRGATHRRAFLTVRAPMRPLEPSGIRSLVRHAYQRAGLEPVAAHQLRHALASDLLRAGASLVAIGQILRHKRLESTTIYAKCAARRSVVSPAQPGGTRRKVLGSNDLPRSER
jgi:site-specific recombinase XerD